MRVNKCTISSSILPSKWRVLLTLPSLVMYFQFKLLSVVLPEPQVERSTQGFSSNSLSFSRWLHFSFVVLRNPTGISTSRHHDIDSAHNMKQQYLDCPQQRISRFGKVESAQCHFCMTFSLLNEHSPLHDNMAVASTLQDWASGLHPALILNELGS